MQNIMLTNENGFLRAISRFPKETFVNPYNKSSKILKASQAFTEGVKSCTAGGILLGKDENHISDVVMWHIDPYKEDKDFNFIKETIISRIGDEKPIQGLLLGSKKMLKESIEMFNKFDEFLRDKLKIPYTKLKGLPIIGFEDNFANLAYNKDYNRWILFLTSLKNFNTKNIKKAVVNQFDEAVISPKDFFSLDQACSGRNIEITDDELKYLLAQS